MQSSPAAAFLPLALDAFRKQKRLGERAIEQMTTAQIFQQLDPEANSIAHIVKHLHGNMRSRWTDFLTSDGEKPDRQRDSEFELGGQEDRSRVLAWWNEGWALVFGAIEPLTEADVSATVRIRGEEMTVMAAIIRQIDHYAQHVGQIVLIAKHLRGPDWTSLSIPRGKSAEFNLQMRPKS